MFGSSWRLGRVFGIELRIDASWAIIALLVGYSFFVRLDFLYEDELTGVETAALAGAAAVVFFLSVLAHELAHSLVATARGIPVRGITLFLFGGATEAKVEGREPKDEFLITAVGPATSLAVGAVLGGLAALIGDLDDPVPGTVGYLAWLNALLAAFNLLPGYPLDGGRLLRAGVWQVTGNLDRATRIAARGGQLVGYLLIGVGLFTLLAGGLGGLWIAAIGWFLSQAAQASYAQTAVDRILSSVDAEDVMTRHLVSVPDSLRIDQAVEEYFLRHDHSAFPVSRDGEMVGLISLRAIRRLGPDQRRTLRVGDCMTPVSRLDTVPGTHPMTEVVERLRDDDDHGRVLVEEQGRIVGIITTRDISRWLRRWRELGLESKHAPSRPDETGSR